jgi:hypothetical protein
MTGFEDLDIACRRLLQAQKQLALAQNAKEAALVRINEDGCPKRQVGQRVADYLRPRYTPEEIARLGLSVGMVKILLSPHRTR